MVLAVNGDILWNVRDEIVQYDIDKLIHISPLMNDTSSIIIDDDVVIGNGCVIGASSLVNNEIPSNCTCAGSPAKVLRSNIEWFTK